MPFQTSDITAVKELWKKEELGSISEFWMMIAAESYQRLPQPQKKSVATSVLERGRFQKTMREESK